MERMIKRIAIRKDGTISMSEFRNFAEKYQGEIDKLEEENKKLKEDNRFLTKISKEYMEKENIVEVTEFTELYKDELEEENKKLKSDLAYERTMLDNVRAEYESLQNVNKNLKEELSKLKEKYGDIDY